MAKDISTSLLSAIRQGVTTLATIVDIVRSDGITYRITNHDTDIFFNGKLYDKSSPFTISAVSTGSQFSVDNLDLSLSLDEVKFRKRDFRSGLFQHAEITISLVDFTDPSKGSMVLRKGWFGPIRLAQFGVANITVVGLLKVLELEIGRVYQPSCDADLGDSRCKVAIDLNQQRDPGETLQAGDWRYVFDVAEATAFTVLNPSFEADGNVPSTGLITGWTKSPANAPIYVNTDGDLAASEGTKILVGDPGSTNTSREETFIYQDVDFASANGPSATDIDAGLISVALFADLAQTDTLFDYVKLQCEILDENDETIIGYDTGWLKFEVADKFHLRNLVFPLLSGARKARIQLGFQRNTGAIYNVAADNIRFYWWDHTLGNPWHSKIHKVVRISNRTDARHAKYPKNDSFQLGQISSLTPSTTQDITDWVKAPGSVWGRASSLNGLLPSPTDRLLVSGDDGTPYEISQTVALVSSWGLGTDRIDLNRYVGAMVWDQFWGAAGTALAQVDLEWYNGSNVLITTDTLLNETSGTVRKANLEVNFKVPANARSLRIVLRGQGAVGFDNITFGVIDTERIVKGDPTTGTGSSSTVFDYTVGSYTFDGALIWRAFTHHVQYDVVASVTDRKSFTGTDIVGVAGAYETGLIYWISGANRGQRNLIRLWNPATKGIKLYFESVNDIQPGDRFQYIRSCQKRFTEDCQLRYDNVLNFRGFPYLPGRVSS